MKEENATHVYPEDPFQAQIADYRVQAERRFLENFRATVPGYRGPAPVELQLNHRISPDVLDHGVYPYVGDPRDVLNLALTSKENFQVGSPHLHRIKVSRAYEELKAL